MFVFVAISEPEDVGGGADPTCVGACVVNPPLAKKLPVGDAPCKAVRAQRLP